jgi:hypothetical protein
MKVRALLFFVLAFLSFQSFAVERMPPDTQFRLTGGTRTGYGDCVGSCLFMETATGAHAAFAITPRDASIGSDFVSNIATTPLFSYTEQIGTIDIFNTILGVWAWRAADADIAFVLPAQNCSDVTITCSPFALVYYPLYLKNPNDNHEYVMANAQTGTQEFHVSEYWKQGNIAYMVVTGILKDRSCSTCGWPNNAKAQLRLYGQLVNNAAKLPAISGVSGGYAATTIIVSGNNLNDVTRVQVNGVDSAYFSHVDNRTLIVYKGENRTPGVVQVFSPTGTSQYPEVFKSTY